MLGDGEWPDLSRLADPKTLSLTRARTQNFRSSFTQREIKMTPSDWRQIEDIDQTIFDEFSIVNHDAFVSHEVAAKALVSDAPLKEYKWYRPDLNREAVTK